MSAVPFGVYWNDPGSTSVEELKWEIGFPVAGDRQVEKPLEIKEWKFESVVSKRYTGPFAEENMKSVYCEIYEWIEKNGYVAARPVLEKYLSMPVPDDAGEMTGTIEIMVPVTAVKERSR